MFFKKSENYLTNTCSITIRGEKLTMINAVKYFGFSLNKNLYCRELKNVLRKISRGAAFYAIKSSFPAHTRIKLMNALVVSHFR